MGESSAKERAKATNSSRRLPRRRRRDEFFQSSQRDGGCRFTSDAFGSDLGFGEGDLGFRYLLDPASGRMDDADGFAP